MDLVERGILIKFAAQSRARGQRGRRAGRLQHHGNSALGGAESVGTALLPFNVIFSASRLAESVLSASADNFGMRGRFRKRLILMARCFFYAAIQVVLVIRFLI